MAALTVAGSCAAQELGHKLLGTLGLQAGVQPPTGLYVVEEFAFYQADQLLDRNGVRAPGQFRLSGVGVAVGAALHYRVPRLATYVSFGFSIPVARISLHSDQVPENLHVFGLADVFVQPLRLGWRLPHVDIVTGYAFYVPSGSIEPGEGPTSVSRAQWTHEIQLGETLYFDHERSWSLSALASFDLNERKIGIDLTRGATIQVQGGLGKTFAGIVTIGPLGYALWQVQNDRGSAVPPALVGARDRAFGLGGELDVWIEKLRSQLFLRYTHDFAVQSRPEGEILLVGITLSAWRPSRRE